MHVELTRRRLLQAGAGAALAGPGERRMDERAVRVGVVGVGGRGMGLLQTLLQIPGVQTPAVCDIVEERTRQAQAIVEKASGVRPEAYTRGDHDYERLCARDDLDAVVSATPWQWHAPIAIASMRAGKMIGTEVPACQTIAECWELVRTSEQTGVPCMMLENVNYFENVLAVLRMVREGVYGDLLHAEAGYQHDCRSLLFTGDGRLTWRGEECAAHNGNLYPTHAIGPVAWWMGINRGDRFTHLTSMSTRSQCVREYARRTFGPDHPLAKRRYALGDVNTTLLHTEAGRTVTLYFTITTPREYDLIFRLQGSRGIYEGGQDRTYLEGVSPTPDTPEPFAPYLAKYAHPLWKRLEEQAKRNGGHGGCDYIVMHEFVRAVRSRTPPQDVYDAVTWSAIVPLSAESVARHGATVPFPDFTRGAWRTNRPVDPGAG